MSEATSINTTVMFADICDSTLLFSKLGDEKAYSLIAQALNLAGGLIKNHNGMVLRTKGDDVLCIFANPEDALNASLAIHDEICMHRLPDLAVSIGLSSGSALLAQGDIQGDTVNIAARLASFAKAGQTLVSSHTIDILDHPHSSMIRPFGAITLKGKSAPVSTFELLNNSESDEITQVGPAPLHFSHSNRMSLKFQSREFNLDFRLVQFRLGRSPDCELILNHPLVSRHHAEISYQDNEFVLRDISTNGTELIINGRSVNLHHKQAALRGKGSIFLGRTTYNRKFEIMFHASGGSHLF
jgi:adenylate cyclase